MKVEIITIGDELLLGQTINTNAAWIGQQLVLLGIEVARCNVIQDTKEAILQAMDDAKNRSDWVLITGGLGPTQDDVTKKALCTYFDAKLVLDREVLEHIETFFQDKGKKILPANRDQALLPEKCEVLPNTKGTASGMLFTKDNTIFVSMPGVPYEMQDIMTSCVLPRIQSENSTIKTFNQTIKTVGVRESYLAEYLKDWEKEVRKNDLKLAYLPSPGIVKLRITAFGKNQDDNKNKVERYIHSLQKLIPDYIFGYEDEKIEEVVGKLLLKKSKTIGTSESCTGGSIAQLITSIPGSSDYYKGSIVSYSNKLKTKLLAVDPALFQAKGAVSEEVVREMATGGLKQLGCDYIIATSGIAGPSGGTKEKPVGTVWIAVGNKTTTKTIKFQLGKDRQRNITMTSIYALNELRKILLEE